MPFHTCHMEYFLRYSHKTQMRLVSFELKHKNGWIDKVNKISRANSDRIQQNRDQRMSKNYHPGQFSVQILGLSGKIGLN